MNIEILHIDDCPNWVEAGARVATALNALGLSEVEVQFQLFRSPDEASKVAFAGSPTVLINGVDAFPSGGRTSDLACRVYMTETGLAGLPTTEQLQLAIEARL